MPETEPRWREQRSSPVIRRGLLPSGDDARLGANEAPYGPPQPVLDAIMRSAVQGNNYAFDASGPLLGGLERWLGVPSSRILLGAGSNDILERAILALAGPGNEIVYPTPAYPIYASATAAGQAVGVPVANAADGSNDLEALRAAVTPNTSLLILCNPHNPTGGHAPTSAIAELVDGVPPGVVILLDEAYWEFSDEFQEGGQGGRGLLDAHPNLVCSRTFSKFFGLAGLRVGYGLVGSEELAAQLRLRQGPGAVTRVSLAGAEAALECIDIYRERLDELRRERERVAAACTELGLDPLPSQTNFLLMPEPLPQTAERMLEHGVWIRPGATMGCPGQIRVTIGTPAQNDRMLELLAGLVEEAGAPGSGDGEPVAAP
ncbi:MAG TPA: aminotransferase class I/II-fold pyridoxal phosphate-dependent enzyme [Candidatus Dormibacteraeota bacterium]|jgi:histidinol-phosphate aminotransferase|nr:aminotransferase class I/II-fold pyridoxal phosphate-dependent enzyme [Candidatus Dormibacteraeota bacterium]